VASPKKSALKRINAAFFSASNMLLIVSLLVSSEIALIKYNKMDHLPPAMWNEMYHKIFSNCKPVIISVMMNVALFFANLIQKS
jgi:hypothetical protein